MQQKSNTGILTKYVRNRHGQPVGAIVAIQATDGNVYIGWSKCNTALDHYSKEMGHHIAMNRALQGGCNINIPYSMRADIEAMEDRCRKYYKNAKDVIVVSDYAPRPRTRRYDDARIVRALA